MSTPSSPLPIPLPPWLMERVKPYLVPYYLTVAAVLGALTVGFVVVITLLVLVAANFNVLGFVE